MPCQSHQGSVCHNLHQQIHLHKQIHNISVYMCVREFKKKWERGQWSQKAVYHYLSPVSSTFKDWTKCKCFVIPTVFSFLYCEGHVVRTFGFNVILLWILPQEHIIHSNLWQSVSLEQLSQENISMVTNIHKSSLQLLTAYTVQS